MSHVGDGSSSAARRRERAVERERDLDHEAFGLDEEGQREEHHFRLAVQNAEGEQQSVDAAEAPTVAVYGLTPSSSGEETATVTSAAPITHKK